MPQQLPPQASHTTPKTRAAATILAALALFAGLPPLTAAAAPAKDVTIHGGWMTPSEYRTLPDGQRGAYVTGVVEGWFHAPAFGAPERNTDRVVQCLGALKPGQLMQAVDLYVSANPAERDKTMNFLVYSALSDFCANRKP
ncbi:hypothetical protein [Bordetella sp. N]|uniref:hypothetical protein n=1 Tax=Bordetella sp. N TaxID=1746199 RepID=UPI00070D95EF|nr:hypothetical protein [Bordetella sp. N]ALM85890.1 hypothetical protein ASB57_25715 [Bordetella sp. N]